MPMECTNNLVTPAKVMCEWVSSSWMENWTVTNGYGQILLPQSSERLWTIYSVVDKCDYICLSQSETKCVRYWKPPSQLNDFLSGLQ